MAAGPLVAQESSTFKDASVDCAWEEWMQLDSVQRSQYGRVKLENSRHLVSLVGHQLSKSNVISELEQGLSLRKKELPGCISLVLEHCHLPSCVPPRISQTSY